MERLITERLVKWKNDPDRMPLVLDGVRQCGKTYILEKFGASNYDNTVYINFEKMTELRRIFEKDLDPRRIISELSIGLGTPIVPSGTLMIFDEIQTCPRALTSLKYFCEDAPDYHIACAGSLLGLLLHGKRNDDAGNLSFPVGKVNRMRMYPMSFPEFLMADGKGALLSFLKDKKTGEPVPGSLASVLEDGFREYLVVGGMPKAVDSWVRKHDLSEVETIQRSILADYAYDFSKYAMDDLRNLTLIWTSVPKQLAKENKKFFFSHVREGARAKDLERSLQWLLDAGLLHKVCLAERPETPLSFAGDNGYFKLYMPDVGLLRAMSGFPAVTYRTDERSASLYKGAVTENYVHNELLALGITPFFWRHDKNEVDFLIPHGMDVVPVEVKAEPDYRASSLANYCRMYGPKTSVIASMRPLKTGVRTFLPLYLIWDIERYLDAEPDGLPERGR